MSESTYQFAPQFADATLTHDSYSKVVTADNLTDDDVKFFTSEKGGSRKDLFIKKGSAAAKAAETASPAAEVTPERALVPEDDLKAEQEAHLASVEKLNTSEAALASEKEAHEATKSQLSEVQAQVSGLTEQVAQLSKELTAAKAKPAKH